MLYAPLIPYEACSIFQIRKNVIPIVISTIVRRKL